MIVRVRVVHLLCLHCACVCRLGDQRVEWMYQGGLAAQEDADKRKEEYLMGKAVDKLPDHGPAEAASRVSTPRFVFTYLPCAPSAT